MEGGKESGMGKDGTEEDEDETDEDKDDEDEDEDEVELEDDEDKIELKLSKPGELDTAEPALAKGDVGGVSLISGQSEQKHLKTQSTSMVMSVGAAGKSSK